MAQLDTTIIGQDISPKFEDPQNALLKRFQLQNAQQEYQQNAIKAQQAQSEYAQQNALAKYMSDPANNLNTATGQAGAFGVGGMKAQTAIKAQSDINKTKTEAEKIGLENHVRKFELMGQLMGGVQDQASYDLARAQAAKIPELADLAPNMPPDYDPNRIKQGYAQAMSVKDRMEQRLKEITQDETGRHNLATEGNANFGQQVTMRGQDMTNARALDAQNAGHYDADRGIMVSKQGVATPVMSGGAPLGEKDKPLNDSQSKALLFGERARQSDKIINGLHDSGVNANTPGMDAPIIGGVITGLSSSKQQSLKQAKTDFMTAILRRESGAAISSSEFTTADKQYFPQIGDSPDVIQQKADNRQLAINGILAEVPSKQRDSIRPASQQAASSQDSAAMAWAKANPSDPRAAKIMKLQGR
jgi:hypothetical protein